MARHTKSRSNSKLFRKIYSPLHHALMATRNVSRGLFRASGVIVNKGLQVVDNTGSSIARHANMAVRNVTSRKSKGRKDSRKNRKNSTRKNRK
jgi:hypothetical protein